MFAAFLCDKMCCLLFGAQTFAGLESMNWHFSLQIYIQKITHINTIDISISSEHPQGHDCPFNCLGNQSNVLTISYSFCSRDD